MDVVFADDSLLVLHKPPGLLAVPGRGADKQDCLSDEECTHVSVWVPLANDRALRFFELAGFKREMATAKTVPIGGVKVEEIRLQRALG